MHDSWERTAFKIELLNWFINEREFGDRKKSKKLLKLIKKTTDISDNIIRQELSLLRTTFTMWVCGGRKEDVHKYMLKNIYGYRFS